MSKYILQKSTGQKGWWIITDTENGIVCEFQQHRFNATQRYTLLHDIINPDANALASIARGIADYLSAHHYDLAMGAADTIEIPETRGAKGIQMGAYICPRKEQIDIFNDQIIEHLATMAPEDCTFKILSATRAGDEAIFAIFAYDSEGGEGTQACVYYPQDDMAFTPTDWQGDYPATPGEIEDYEWWNSAGDSAIILAGLPRAFTPIRDQARKEFGEMIRSLRESKGLKQEELARRAGLRRPNIARIESGRYGVTLDTITRLSAALGEELI